jgi:hypothetical protein
MRNGEWVLWLVAVLLLAGFCFAIASFYSAGARLRRRRRRSHSRLISKTSRPSVRFSVKPPKE